MIGIATRLSRATYNTHGRRSVDGVLKVFPRKDQIDQLARSVLHLLGLYVPDYPDAQFSQSAPG